MFEFTFAMFPIWQQSFLFFVKLFFSFVIWDFRLIATVVWICFLILNSTSTTIFLLQLTDLSTAKFFGFGGGTILSDSQFLCGIPFSLETANAISQQGLFAVLPFLPFQKNVIEKTTNDHHKKISYRINLQHLTPSDP